MSRNLNEQRDEQLESQRLEIGLYFNPYRAKEERDFMRWGHEGFDEVPSALCQFCYVKNGDTILCKEHRHD